MNFLAVSATGSEILRTEDGGTLEVELVPGGSVVVNWATDLLTSTDATQWVVGLSGQNGAGGVIAQRTAATVVLTQGGTPLVPVVETMWKLQPQNNPDASAVAPFAMQSSGSLNSSGTTFNHTMGVGYNPGLLYSLSEPQVTISFESNFEAAPGVHQTELHIIHGLSQNLGGATTRVLSSEMNRATGSTGVGLIFNSVASDPVPGQLTFEDFATSTLYGAWNGQNQLLGTLDDFIAFGGTHASTGAVRLPRVGGVHGVSGGVVARATLGAWDLVLARGDQIDEITFGEVVPAGGGNPNGATGFLFAGRTQAQGGSFVSPVADNDLDLGLPSNRWRQGAIVALTIDSLVTNQVTKTGNYTINSTAGAPDYQVWIDSSGGIFTLTLPAAAKGLLFLIVDKGNALATHNVTLQSPAGSINGGGTTLALATNGASYTVVSDGTNWWTGKMVVGG